MADVDSYAYSFVVVRAEYMCKKPTNLTCVERDNCFFAGRALTIGGMWGCSHVEAAALPLAGQTALQSFRLGQLTENKKVLITGGAGGVGSIAIQIAKTVFKVKY